MEEVNDMTKQVTAIKARQNLGELLEEVYYRNDHVAITRRNKIMAVLIPVEEYERWMQRPVTHSSAKSAKQPLKRRS
jgi:prevent-host-death family protein